MIKLPLPTIQRLVTLLDICDDLLLAGVTHVSSSVLADKTAWTAESIRKDISCLDEAGNTGSAGYQVTALKRAITVRLGLDQPRKACVVGLGRLGSAILAYERFAGERISIAAGFDSNSNRLETIRTTVPVYPAYQIADVVRREGIQLGIIAVSADGAVSTMDALVRGGVQGIVNLAPVILKPASDGVVIRNMNLINELRIVASLINLNQLNNQPKE